MPINVPESKLTRVQQGFYQRLPCWISAFITALRQLPLDVNLKKTWGEPIHTEPPGLSAKENAQRVEFVVFEIKEKPFIQLRSGSLFGKRTNQ